jgi:hypothetical protein
MLGAAAEDDLNTRQMQVRQEPNDWRNAAEARLAPARMGQVNRLSQCETSRFSGGLWIAVVTDRDTAMH